MTPEKVQAEIKFSTEMIKVYIALIIVIGGGTMSLILAGLEEIKNYMMGLIGMIAVVSFIVATIFTFKKVRKLLNHLS